MDYTRKLGCGVASLLAAGALFGMTTCALRTTVPDQYVAVHKDPSGVVTYHDGPKWKFLGLGSNQVAWDGRQIVDLPLGGGSEESQFYKSADGLISIDIIVNYKRGQSKEQRDKWFVEKADPVAQFEKSVEGIARSTIIKYTSAEILNENIAVQNGKLPFTKQLHLDLYGAQISDEFGIDKTSYAVWPGNISLPARVVGSDLERQRKKVLREGHVVAQENLKKAAAERAHVDSEYAKFLSNLDPAVQEYLRNYELTNAVRATARAEGQDLDLQIIVK
jgi:hypothetical protein